MKLALLDCGYVAQPIRDIHGDNGRAFRNLLEKSNYANTPFVLDSYDVQILQYPPDDRHYDGLLISGSRSSAYEDVEWINTLVAYVKRIIAEKPTLKIFGICFGHQIVARALGGSCVPNNGRWEVSVTTTQLTPLGKTIFGTETLDLQQMHRDHVPTVPPGAHLLAWNDVTPNHGMVVFDTASVPEHIDLTSIRVLTVQGHPEYTESMMSMLLKLRVALLGEELVNDGLLRVGGIPGKHHPDGLACDGVGRFGKVIWGVLGVV